MHKKADMKRQEKKKYYTVMAVLCLVAFLITVGVIVRDQIVSHRQANTYAALGAQVLEPVQAATDRAQKEVRTENESKNILEQRGIEVPVLALDWDALHAQNEDIYGWIYIPNTNINYPVLQHPTDDNYYLTHNLDGSGPRPGCIFSDRINRKDFTDPHTVLYGHNMNNGTMFHDLHLFEDDSFFEGNRFIYIYTPVTTLVYEIFAAYPFSDEYLLYSYDRSNSESFASYLEMVRSNEDEAARIRRDVDVTKEDHILTLSTCIRYQAEKRYLVQGVLVNKEDLRTYETTDIME